MMCVCNYYVPNLSNVRNYVYSSNIKHMNNIYKFIHIYLRRHLQWVKWWCYLAVCIEIDLYLNRIQTTEEKTKDKEIYIYKCDGRRLSGTAPTGCGWLFKRVAIAEPPAVVNWARADPRRCRCHAVVDDRGRDVRLRRDADPSSCVSCPPRDHSSCRTRRRRSPTNFRRNCVVFYRCSNL